MRLRRTLTVAFATAAGLGLVVAPAQASPGDAVAEGAAGALTIGDLQVEPIAPCSTEGQPDGESGEVAVSNVAVFGPGTSTCVVDEAGEHARTTVSGGRFRFDGLRGYGGPRIRLSSFAAKCESTLTGSTSSIEFSGLSGVKVPAQLGSNHVVTVPGGPDGKPMATVTFNEVLFPTPPDGSLTVHLMHIRMFPQGGPTSGDAYVGTVHCSPVS